MNEEQARLSLAGRYDVAAVPADAFTARVAVRAGVDDAEAREVTEAVLGTLAERLPPGEVDDLLTRLPAALHPVLREARAGSAPRMNRDELLARVVRRTGASPEEACEYTRAVLATLRESLTAEEFFDLTVQLPDDFRMLLPDT
jgi:uncharacterized protein (DUF2267 family)